MTDVRARMAGDSVAAHGFYHLARLLVRVWATLWFRLSVRGRDRIPASGPFVLAPVHRSNIDTPIAAMVARKRLRFMGKDGLWKVRPAGWLFSALGGFPVTREKTDREAMRRCVEVLESGEPLVLFPEGERKGGPVVQPLMDGAAYLAIRCQVPVVPVGLGGTERAMGKGARMIRPTKVTVIVGDPILPPPLAGDSGRVARSAVRSLSAQLHAEIQRLFDEAQAAARA